LKKPLWPIPKLIEAVGDRDPAGHARLITRHGQRSDTLGYMLVSLR